MASLKKIMNDISGASEEELKEKENLDFLLKSASTKLELAQNDIAQMLQGHSTGIGQLYVVPDSVIESDSGFHVSAGEEMDQGLAAAVDLFFKGSKESVKAGFQTMVKSALSAFFADTMAGEQTKRLYFVTMTNFALIRVDLFVWKYYFEQKGLSDQVQQAFCYTFTKSVIDHTKVSNDFLLATIEPYTDDDPDAIKTYLQELFSVFKYLEGQDPRAVTAKAKEVM